jgi:multidrug efflux pump subunit AcrA (membrane-fusion protein)
MTWKAVFYTTALMCMAGIMLGCSGIGLNKNAPLPTLQLDGPGESSIAADSTPRPSSAGVVASGNIVAAREVNVSSGSGGIVLDLLVQAGDEVSAGQVLVRLSGGERLTAALESARLDLLSAQQAREVLDDTLGGERAAAQLRLANANQVLDDAQKKRTWRNYRNGSDSLIAAGQADLILAKDALEKAQDVYDSVSSLDDYSVTKAGALSALATAQRAYDRAVGNLNYLIAMPDPLEVAKVEAELVSARVEVDSARAGLEKLKDGPDAQAATLAEARIANAQAAVTAAQAALADLEVKAPMSGTVAVVHVEAGEWAQPGQPLLVLVDLDHLNVQTSDLSERDVAQIRVGQPATVTINAMDAEASGTVILISPLADTLGGDVIYQTTIRLDEWPEGMLPGMSVDVRIMPNP